MSKQVSGMLVLAFTLAGLTCGNWVFAHRNPTKAIKPQAPAIDINKASVDDFQKLPGIGPSLAKRIVVYRDKNGPFKRIEDLMVIRGVGFKKWKKLRPYVKVEER